MKISVFTTLLVSFIKSAQGCPWSPVVFWLVLFSAAAMSDPGDEQPEPFRRWM